MAGNKSGGLAAAKLNKEKYGEDFYKRIGAIGGKKGTTGGFYGRSEAARLAGSKGGKVSKRTKPWSAEEREKHMNFINGRKV